MDKLFAALIACVLASAAGAQTAAPAPSRAERQKDVATSTLQQGDNSASTRATAAEQAQNVKASKQVQKLSTQEKSKLAKDATKLNVNPENSSGQAATAAMQKQTTAESKAAAKQNAELKSKEGKQQLEKDLQKKATP